MLHLAGPNWTKYIETRIEEIYSKLLLRINSISPHKSKPVFWAWFHYGITRLTKIDIGQKWIYMRVLCNHIVILWNNNGLKKSEHNSWSLSSAISNMWSIQTVFLTALLCPEFWVSVAVPQQAPFELRANSRKNTYMATSKNNETKSNGTKFNIENVQSMKNKQKCKQKISWAG